MTRANLIFSIQIGRLKALRSLALSGNAIEHIPESVGELASLRVSILCIYSTYMHFPTEEKRTTALPILNEKIVSLVESPLN
jgi:hypothetical protein